MESPEAASLEPPRLRYDTFAHGTTVTRSCYLAKLTGEAKGSAQYPRSSYSK